MNTDSKSPRSEKNAFYAKLCHDFNAPSLPDLADHFTSLGLKSYSFKNNYYKSSRLIPGGNCIEVLCFFGFDSDCYESCSIVNASFDFADILPLKSISIGMGSKNRLIALCCESREVFAIPLDNQCGSNCQYGEFIIADNFEEFIRGISLLEESELRIINSPTYFDKFNKLMSRWAYRIAKMFVK